MTMRAAVAIVVALASVAGCASDTTAPTAAPSTTGTAFTVTGLVRDTVLRPVAGARVAISGGPNSGSITTTDDDGRFAFTDLTPPSDSVPIEVTKLGFATATATVRHNGTALITLSSAEMTSSEGVYAVTFTAACEGLPAGLRVRTYQAEVRANRDVPASASESFVVSLGGADMYRGYDRFTARFAPDAALLSVYSLDPLNWWLEDHPVFERVNGGGYVSFMGRATGAARGTGGPIDTVFDGTVGYCAAAQPPTPAQFPPTCGVEVIACSSAQHRLTLVRR